MLGAGRKPGWLALLVSTAALLLLPAAAAHATPPTLLTAGQIGGRMTATWTLPPGMAMDYIEAANMPGVNPGDGDFPLVNTVLAESLDDFQTSYLSTIEIPPGTYFVHVFAYDTEKCATGDEAACVDEGSNILPFTIPGSEGPDALTGFELVNAPSPQRVGKLLVEASMREPGTITATGTVRLSKKKTYRFKTVSASVQAGVSTTLRLRLSAKALKAVKRALKRHRKLKAKLTITGKDRAGNVVTQTRTVKLRR